MERDPLKFPKRDILCIDCKSFFASVECVAQGLDPMTAKLCVVSRGHLQGGLVLASSPRMKEEYGIGTGCRLYQLPKQDPDLVLVPPRMGLYIQRNWEISQIFRQYVADEDFHPYSIDEAFLDVTHSHQLFGSTYQMGRQIQRQIYQRYGIPTCVGIGDNLLLAKLCLDNAAKKRPPYLAYWSYERVPQTLWTIDTLTDFWGIGHRTQARLHQIGIYTVKQLAEADMGRLYRAFGVKGLELYYHAHGLDGSIISQPYQPQQRSYSMSQILPHDYHRYDQVALLIREMAEQLASRLRQSRKMTTRLSLHLGYGKGAEVGGSGGQMTLPLTWGSQALIAASQDLLAKHYLPLPVRRLALAVGSLQAVGAQQLSLFDDLKQAHQREQADQVMDQIHQRYGAQSLVRASSLLPGATALQRLDLIGGHQG